MSTDRIRVLCIDDHTVVREGIALLIGRQPDMECVGTGASGEEAIALFRSTHPDVTLMDLRLRSMGGLDAIRVIRQDDRDARIVVLTMYQGDEDIRRALKAGAATYILKDTLSDDLVRIIRQVNNGERPVPPDVTKRLAEARGDAVLTAREEQVLGLISEGLRNKEIAVVLGISEETAEVHVKHLLAKLKVRDRTAAMNVGLRRGILHIP